jgi:hypothetical protein
MKRSANSRYRPGHLVGDVIRSSGNTITTLTRELASLDLNYWAMASVCRGMSELPTVSGVTVLRYRWEVLTS